MVDFLDNILHIHLCLNDDLCIQQEERTAVKLPNCAIFLVANLIFTKGDKITDGRNAMWKGSQRPT